MPCSRTAGQEKAPDRRGGAKGDGKAASRAAGNSYRLGAFLIHAQEPFVSFAVGPAAASVADPAAALMSKTAEDSSRRGCVLATEGYVVIAEADGLGIS